LTARPHSWARIQGTLQDLGCVEIRGADIMQDRNMFLVAGIVPTAAYDAAEPAFSQSIRSFRPLTCAEAEGIGPNHVGLYTPRDGDTRQSIARRLRTGVVKATTLAILNSHAVSDQPRPGERLKIVVAG
jgi:predicted Zn-dependent protease